MGPLPYSVRWTSRLIYRDLKGLAAGCINKLRGMFSSTGDASTCTNHHQVAIETSISAGHLHNDTPTSSASTSPYSPSMQSASTPPTELSQTRPEVSSTLYNLLDGRLKALYASRKRDLPHDERWIFRGAWLLLDEATQHCASNPTYDILRPSSSNTNETTLLLQVLQHSISNPFNASTAQANHLPRKQTTGCIETPTRHDSAYDSFPYQRNQTPTPAEFWHAIVAGASDRATTVQAAEYLLGYVWPEKRARGVLEAMGHPALKLSEKEGVELRERLSVVCCFALSDAGSEGR